MDRDADALYGLPRDAFIARRGELAKSLRKDGRRDEAAAVAALRKPSVAAWAVNQLVRTQRSSVQELLDAGDALRDAQSDLLAGEGDGRTLRAASDRERAAVEDLVERARGLLSSAGDELSPAVIERVADTLHAAALDEEARDQVRDGRLERELRHAGLGLGLGESGLIAPEPRRPRPRAAEAATAEAPEGEGPAGRSAGAQRRAAKPKREPADPKPTDSRRESGEAKREGEPAEPKRTGAKGERGAAKRAARAGRAETRRGQARARRGRRANASRSRRSVPGPSANASAPRPSRPPRSRSAVSVPPR